ncbi:MAG: hydrogenase formation protein HypD [Candidatus Omnitrophica bacterium]|nr:hydrogenase formation protein HypD [Candidatus Omnitrophota bacterium]
MKRTQVIEQFKDSKIARRLLDRINRSKQKVSLMEVCGTHTVQIFKTGVRAGINSNIKLLSGPGCPVCVTSVGDVDKAIAIASSKDVILCCFGDMIKVPGTSESLDLAKGKSGANVKIMYSPIEALGLAKQFPNKKIVLFGVGFETTIPAFASVLVRAKQQNIKNLFIFPVFKLIPPAISVLLESKFINIDGFILPGHVSTIIGQKQYQFIAEEFGKPAVITGFEVVDILEGILFLLEMIERKQPDIRIEYGRSVSPQGNTLAMQTIFNVFEKADVEWRGLGTIKQSGLKLNHKFSEFDVDRVLEIKIKLSKENPKCICGNVIKGINQPLDCKLYAKECSPEHPVGPCMVSSEGTCSAFYKYGEQHDS